MTAYEQGFLTKCAEYGIRPFDAGRMLKMAQQPDPFGWDEEFDPDLYDEDSPEAVRERWVKEQIDKNPKLYSNLGPAKQRAFWRRKYDVTQRKPGTYEGGVRTMDENGNPVEISPEDQKMVDAARHVRELMSGANSRPPTQPSVQPQAQTFVQQSAHPEYTERVMDDFAGYEGQVHDVDRVPTQLSQSSNPVQPLPASDPKAELNRRLVAQTKAMAAAAKAVPGATATTTTPDGRTTISTHARVVPDGNGGYVGYPTGQQAVAGSPTPSNPIASATPAPPPAPAPAPAPTAAPASTPSQQRDQIWSGLNDQQKNAFRQWAQKDGRGKTFGAMFRGADGKIDQAAANKFLKDNPNFLTGTDADRDAILKQRYGQLNQQQADAFHNSPEYKAYRQSATARQQAARDRAAKTSFRTPTPNGWAEGKDSSGNSYRVHQEDAAAAAAWLAEIDRANAARGNAQAQNAGTTTVTRRYGNPTPKRITRVEDRGGDPGMRTFKQPVRYGYHFRG